MTALRLRSRWTGALAMALILGLSSAAEAQRAAAGPPDWPCVQRLIPQLGWGTIWDGPPIDRLEEKWWSDEEVGRVVRFASARETRLDDAVERVKAFAGNVAEDRERRLTLLFAGLFERINRERTRTIEAIRRYARGQVKQLERISGLVDKLDELRGSDDQDPERIQEVEQALFWQRRIFEDRQASLQALCDQPYMLEERLSRLVRAIRAEL